MTHPLANISAGGLLEWTHLSEPPYDPYLIAQRLGIKIDTELDFENISLSGYISKKGNSTKIWLNPLDPPNRQRFTLAHEIAHYINDILPTEADKEIIDTPETMYNRDGNQNSCETRANNYAGQLLMPKKDVLNKIKVIISENKSDKIEIYHIVEKLADIFNVSKASTLVRLKVLGVIPQSYELL